jgi:hypothetical protein
MNEIRIMPTSDYLNQKRRSSSCDPKEMPSILCPGFAMLCCLPIGIISAFYYKEANSCYGKLQ